MKKVSVEIAPVILNSYDFLDLSFNVSSKQEEEISPNGSNRANVNIGVEATNNGSLCYVKLDLSVIAEKPDKDTIDELSASICIRGIFKVVDESLSSTKIQNYLAKTGASELYQIARDYIARYSQDTSFDYFMLPSMVFK